MMIDASAPPCEADLPQSSLHNAITQQIEMLRAGRNALAAGAHRGCLVLGVMSGTSLDGIDLALTRITGTSPGGPQPLRVIAIERFETAPMPPRLRRQLRRALHPTAESRDGESDDDDDGMGATTAAALLCRINTEWAREVGAMCVAFLDRWAAEQRHAGRATEAVLAAELASVVIASHGQTVWHESGHSTLQLGDGEVLAKATGRVVVSNFRAADVAVGGTGAPLVPYLDGIIASSLRRRLPPAPPTPGRCCEGGRSRARLAFPVALQNIGGIGNVTLVQSGRREGNADGDQEEEEDGGGACGGGTCGGGVVAAAFDTGPGNVVLNELAECAARLYGAAAVRDAVRAAATEAQQALSAADEEALREWSGAMDVNGLLSRFGAVNAALLRDWLAHPFFAAPPPKSTGREDFGAAFVATTVASHGVFPQVDRRDKQPGRLDARRFFDACRTAVELTALTIDGALRTHLGGRRNSSSGRLRLPRTLVLCGGGSHHPGIVEALRRAAGESYEVLTMRELELEGCSAAVGDLLNDAKEAVAFAVLGHERLVAAALPFAAAAEATATSAAGGEAFPVVRPPTTNLVCVTGARRGVALGQLSEP